MKKIEVVSGVIIDDGRLLLTQRRPDKPFAFAWETPGGAVEIDQGESYLAALRRELREELGINAGVSEFALDSHAFESEGCLFYIAFYRVTDFIGTIAPKEGQGLGWFTADQLPGTLTLTPGTAAAMPAIRDVMRR